MTLRRINDFDTANPAKLADQLSRLEDNISREFSRFAPRLTWLDWTATFPAQASYGSVLRGDTATATAAVGVSLPSISNDTISTLVGVVRKGAQNIVLEPVEDSALIDGAPTATLAADGLYLYMHDGATWYRA